LKRTCRPRPISRYTNELLRNAATGVRIAQMDLAPPAHLLLSRLWVLPRGSQDRTGRPLMGWILVASRLIRRSGCGELSMQTVWEFILVGRRVSGVLDSILPVASIYGFNPMWTITMILPRNGYSLPQEVTSWVAPDPCLPGNPSRGQ